jgi:hypothetical protein
MTLSRHNEALTANRIAAGALAALGAASAIPIPLAQLDFAGLFNVFNIDSGDSSRALLVIAAALAGLVTAMPLWIPAGVVIGAAALILGPSSDPHAAIENPRRNRLRTTGVTTRTRTRGET